MERDGVDALVLGREANARAVSGANRLWLAGTRAFAPGCVVVRSTRVVHLLANSDDGFEDFPPRTSTPSPGIPTKLLAALGAIPGFTDARRRSASTACHPASTRCSASCSRRRSSSTPGPIIAELWRCTRPRRSTAVHEAARRRVQRARGDGRLSPGRRARPRPPRRVRRAIRLARRHHPRLRSRRLADRRRRLDVAPARTPARRRRARRAPRRRTSQRLGSLARAHVRGR